MKVKRIVIAKVGLDGHDRGAKIISRYLRDSGFEVIYTGIRQTPENVAKIAIQEDANIIGISILSGAHNHLIKKLLDILKGYDVDIPIIVGGIIPEVDRKYLRTIGVKGIFTSGTTLKEIEKEINAII